MLTLERHRLILERLNDNGSVRVTELAGEFEVTTETIRRDLDRLEADGKLQRSHGGAVPRAESSRETPYWQREALLAAEKRAIAAEAVTRVVEGDTILIDASSTTLFAAKALPDIPLTVLTNSMQAAIELAGRQHVDVMGIGGIVSPNSLSFVGPLALSNLEKYHVDKLFLSCRGIDLVHGLSDANEQQAALRRAMLDRANVSYLLVDHSKFDHRALSAIGPINDVTEIITDNKADARMIRGLRDTGVSVTITK
jgi:DeoR/GlpR family transcriptional regulator of sugar metabolism